MGGIDLLCICDMEWCFCTNSVFIDEYDPRYRIYPAPEVACEDCKAGKHVMEPGGSRG
jgi:hypothetical protein